MWWKRLLNVIVGISVFIALFPLSAVFWAPDSEWYWLALGALIILPTVALRRAIIYIVEGK